MTRSATLSAGTRLGSYEILAPIGAGGMGEVYRARDTQLGRDVAIKVVGEGLAADPEHMARFEREARLLASVDHPNVAAIHGIEERHGLRIDYPVWSPDGKWVLFDRFRPQGAAIWLLAGHE